jgi:pyruvate kinase
VKKPVSKFAFQVHNLRRYTEASKTINIISKVENMEGLDNYDEIVEKSDAVMVARGGALHVESS